MKKGFHRTSTNDAEDENKKTDFFRSSQTSFVEKNDEKRTIKCEGIHRRFFDILLQMGCQTMTFVSNPEPRRRAGDCFELLILVDLLMYFSCIKEMSIGKLSLKTFFLQKTICTGRFTQNIDVKRKNRKIEETFSPNEIPMAK